MLKLIRNKYLNYILLGIIIIGLFLATSAVMRFNFQTSTYSANFRAKKEDYLKTHVSRTIEMIDMELENSHEKYRDQMANNSILAHKIVGNTTTLDQWTKTLDNILENTPHIQFLIINPSTTETLYQSGDLDYKALLLDRNHAMLESPVNPTLSFIQYMTGDQLIEQVKKDVAPLIRNIRLEDNGYVWVNEVLNYDGGDDYAIRRVHANLQDSEGALLTTNAQDAVGNKPYQLELDGINESGEVIFEYYFKKMGSDIVSQKMSYAKLYEPFDWIVATGVHVDDMYKNIGDYANNLRQELFIELIFIFIGLMVIIAFYYINQNTLKENKDYEVETSRLNEELLLESKKLSKINITLQEEIEERKEAELKIKEINDSLDQTIKERTNELELLSKMYQKVAVDAEAASDAKSQFLSIMSHEMRTPLNAIMGFLQMLETTDLNDEQKEYSLIIKNSSDTLLHLINDILDAEKYTAGKMKFSEDTFNLMDTLSSAASPFRLLIQRKNLRFNLNLDDSLDVSVKGDESKIIQLVHNFLSNALKFTNEGMITVDAKAKDIKGKTKLFMTVSDTGIGIPEKYQGQLFSPFTQADEHIQKVYGGTGLGLTICSNIVSNYGGSINYESKLNQGTSFIIQMTFDRNDDGLSTSIIRYSENSHPDNQYFTGTLLVAEDNEVNQKLMKSFLSEYDLTLLMASNGLEAVEITRENQVDIILMDYQMPIMSGLEAASIIKDEQGNSVEIIALTAYASESDRQACLDHGMTSFFTKPVDLKSLAQKLKLKASTNGNSKTENKRAKLIDDEVKHLMTELDFDYDTCKELIDTFILVTKDEMAKVPNYLDDHDYDKLLNKLHKLKGSAGTIRIARFRTKFEKAEQLAKDEDYENLRALLDTIMDDPLFT